MYTSQNKTFRCDRRGVKARFLPGLGLSALVMPTSRALVYYTSIAETKFDQNPFQLCKTDYRSRP